MSRFEYLSVLISIVLALGIGEVTVAWGRLLQNRARVRFSWLYAFWSAYMVFLIIQFWWGFWNFRVLEAWSFTALVLVVVEAIVLVICAIILTPVVANGFVDLQALYFKSARPFFLLGAVLLVLFTVSDTLVMQVALYHPENVVRMLAAVVICIMAFTANRRLHHALPAVAIVLLVAFLLNVILL